VAVKATDVRVSRLRDQDRADLNDLSKTTPAQRLQMVWQLTLDAWAFKGEPVGEFRKDIVQVIRPQAKQAD
jgi:hypothetical protein